MRHASETSSLVREDVRNGDAPMHHNQVQLSTVTQQVLPQAPQKRSNRKTMQGQGRSEEDMHDAVRQI